jgi:prepilin-type processing-associated H-X9-DG protein
MDPGYGMNYLPLGGPTGNGVALSKIKRPAEMLFMADQVKAHSCCIYASDSAANPSGHLNHSGTFGGISIRHNQGANIGYVDGHGKWCRGSNFNDYRLWANVI